MVLAEISKGLYVLCQASQLVLFLTSPKITRTDMDFCFEQCLGEGQGRRALVQALGSERCMWVGYSRAIFPDSLT